MFRLYITTFICLLFASCGVLKSDDDIKREFYEAYLLEHLDEPSTYEFISLKTNRPTTLRSVFNSLRDPNRDQDPYARWGVSNFPLFYAMLDSLEEAHASDLDRVVFRTLQFKFIAANKSGVVSVQNDDVLLSGFSPDFELRYGWSGSGVPIFLPPWWDEALEAYEAKGETTDGLHSRKWYRQGL